MAPPSAISPAPPSLGVADLKSQMLGNTPQSRDDSRPISPNKSAKSLTTTELTASAVAHAEEPKPAKPQLDASKLTYRFNPNPKEVPATDDPIVWEQNTATDHMVSVKWTENGGWETPELKPYGPLMLMPTASCLHYATEAFEGMKAYRGVDGKVRIFRPNLNCNRMTKSSVRIALPNFPPEELEKLIIAFLEVDCPAWLPDNNSFIYIRPTIIASGAALGVQKPREATIFIIMVKFPRFDEGPAMKLLASRDDMVRAWPGGFGYAKVGANYGPSLMAQGEARERGFDQILWLFGPEGRITEAGASNFFVVWRNKTTDRLELVTAPLDDKIVLDGVTRRSVLELARARLSFQATEEDKASADLERVDVVERNYTITDILEAHSEGRLIEAFVSGTAFFIAGIQLIHYKDKDTIVPTPDVEGPARIGAYAKTLKRYLKEIMYGVVDHPWAVIINETGPQ